MKTRYTSKDLKEDVERVNTRLYSTKLTLDYLGSGQYSLRSQTASFDVEIENGTVWQCKAAAYQYYFDSIG